jgi:site-specific DNA-cytosine methylase
MTFIHNVKPKWIALENVDLGDGEDLDSNLNLIITALEGEGYAVRSLSCWWIVVFCCSCFYCCGWCYFCCIVIRCFVFQSCDTVLEFKCLGCMLVDTSLYYLPQRRKRFYIVCVALAMDEFISNGAKVALDIAVDTYFPAMQVAAVSPVACLNSVSYVF